MIYMKNCNEKWVRENQNQIRKKQRRSPQYLRVICSLHCAYYTIGNSVRKGSTRNECTAKQVIRQ